MRKGGVKACWTGANSLKIRRMNGGQLPVITTPKVRRRKKKEEEEGRMKKKKEKEGKRKETRFSYQQ